MQSPPTLGEAVLSPCKRYRYALHRRWSAGPKSVVFIGLNPSTADANSDDPTLRRCIAFARSWGFDALVMLNLFAFRATNPRVLLRKRDPIGADNDAWLARFAAQHPDVVACWGNLGSHRARDQHVLALLPRCLCIATTRAGQPAHPLYLRAGLKPRPYIPR